MDKSIDIQNLKIEIIHWLTGISDKKVLNKILALKKKENSFELSAEQEAELERRLAEYDRGEMIFKSWEEVEASERRRSKHVR